MPHFDNHGLKGGVWRGALTGIDAPGIRAVSYTHLTLPTTPYV